MKTIEDELYYNGEKILTYNIQYPEFMGAFCREALMIYNSCQKEKALAYQKYCETVLYPRAVEDYKNAIKNDFLVRIYEAMVVCGVTYNEGCVISLFFDIYEYTGGAHGSTIRCADSSDLKNSQSIMINQLVECPPNYKIYILGKVLEEIRKDPSIYFEDYSSLIATTFNDDNFYCKKEGIIIFYQQYDIAPYASGIREFLLKYSDCVLEPTKV